MKKIVFISFLVAVWGLSLQAQTYVFQVKPVGSKTWGYADLEGNMVIPATYDKTFAFSENGLAAVYNSKEKQYAFINLKNERLTTEVSKFSLNEVFGFKNGGYQEDMVLVKIAGKWGYFNSVGKLVIPAKYTAGSDFSEGFAFVKEGSNQFIIDKTGKETAIGKEIADIRDFIDGLAPCKQASDSKVGFLNSKGQVVIPAIYANVGYFSNGLAWAKTAEGKVGFINKKGEWVIEPVYEAVKDFDLVYGLALVRKGEQWMYVNKAGEERQISDSEKLTSFSNGLAEGKKGGLFGFYNNKGEWIIEPQFQNVNAFVNGYACAKSGELWGIINTKGEWVVKAQYLAVKSVSKVK